MSDVFFCLLVYICDEKEGGGVFVNMWVNYLFVQSFNEREILRVRVNGDDRFVGLEA